jgi:hypothetical protein
MMNLLGAVAVVLFVVLLVSRERLKRIKAELRLIHAKWQNAAEEVLL